MRIYFNGDSNVAGTELADPKTQGFAAKLSNKLNATFINEAGHGASNSLILRRTDAYLAECKRTNSFPDFVVIGWTECTREDWYVGGQYCSISSIGLEKPEVVDPESYNFWLNNLQRNMFFMHEMSKFYNRAIHNLHLELNDLGIPHFFFNAINVLNHCDAWQGSENDKILKLNWGDSYYHPYNDTDFTWRNWAVNNKYKQITDGWFHFDEQCQDDWTDLMYNYIKEKQLV